MPDTKKEPTDEDKKNLKKLLEAHTSVLEHRLGRSPSMEELLEFCKTEDTPSNGAPEATSTETPVSSEPPAPIPPETVMSDSSAEPEPKVLHYKVYYGMKTEKSDDGKQSKSPDPRAILFFESPEGRVYDTKAHDWCPDRPAVMDHLNSRPMMFDEQGYDIMAALVNGVLDDEDYSSLDSADMLNDHHRQIWKLNKQLQSQMDELEKSELPPDSPVQNDDPPAQSPGSPEETGPSVEEPAEGSPAEDLPQGGGVAAEEMPGENLVAKIVEAAMADVHQNIRNIVAEECSKHFSSFISAMEALDVEPGAQEFQQYQETTTNQPV